MTDAALGDAVSNQAIAAAGVVYFLALLAHLVEWSALRKVPVARAGAGRRGGAVPPTDRPRSSRRRPARPTERRRRARRTSRCSAGSGCC